MMGWFVLGTGMLVLAAFLNWGVALLAAAGAVIVLLAHINRTMGHVVRLGHYACRAYTLAQDDCVPALQAFCVAMIKWRGI